MTDSTTTAKPPVWFWVVTVLALLWNLMGVAAYLNTVYMTPEGLAEMTPEQQTFFQNTPGWVTGAYALAVFGGALGCLLLLLKRRLALSLLIVSLVAVLVQNFYYFVQTNALEVFGAFQAVVMPVVVIVICLLLVMLARKAISNGWVK